MSAGSIIPGINPTSVDTIPQFKLGDIAGFDDLTDGYKEFMYGSAVTTFAAGTVAVEGIAVGAMSSISTTNTAGGQLGGHGSRVGVAQATLAIGQYGWFQVFGKTSALTAGAVALGTRLNTTATVGAVDDDGTVGSRAINGMVFKTAPAGAAVSVDCRLGYPTVGVTL